jgi:hypothetical protein
MARPKPTTTERGYGYDHQRRRQALLPAALGQPCPGPAFGPRSPRCTGLMLNPKHMDLDHTTPKALGGRQGDRIVCSPCNRGSGARLGNAIRRATRRAAPTPIRSRDW